MDTRIWDTDGDIWVRNDDGTWDLPSYADPYCDGPYYTGWSWEKLRDELGPLTDADGNILYDEPGSQSRPTWHVSESDYKNEIRIRDEEIARLKTEIRHLKGETDAKKPYVERIRVRLLMSNGAAEEFVTDTLHFHAVTASPEHVWDTYSKALKTPIVEFLSGLTPGRAPRS